MKYFQVLSVFLTVYLVRFATTYENGSLVDYRFTQHLNKAASPNDICTNLAPDKLACSDCHSVVYCKQSEDGTWTITDMGKCPQGKVCRKGHCVTSSICPFPNLPFICSSAGVFPDPGDCAKYHFCVPNGVNIFRDYPMDCENNIPTVQYGYNPVTTFCSDKISNGQCSKMNVPACKNDFDVGVIPNNPTLYYECRKYISANGEVTDTLYPFQSRCDNGKSTVHHQDHVYKSYFVI